MRIMCARTWKFDGDPSLDSSQVLPRDDGALWQYDASSPGSLPCCKVERRSFSEVPNHTQKRFQHERVGPFCCWTSLELTWTVDSEYVVEQKGVLSF